MVKQICIYQFSKPMQVKIDKAGRIVLPKAVRERHGLTEGTLLDVDETDGAIVLCPVRTKPPVRMKDGILVVSAETVGDIEGAVAQEREARLRHTH